MRKRPLIVLSTVATATLLLAGCSGGETPEPSDTSSPSAEASCLADLKAGEASDAVTVEGDGADAKISAPADLTVDEPERTVLSEGKGDDVHAGDLVSVRYQLVDAGTAEVLASSELGPDAVLPALLSDGSQQQQNYDLTQEFAFTAAVECIPLGSRVVLAIPSGQEGVSPRILYVETIDELPTVATGTEVDAPEGMPEVELDDSGAPTITIPEGDAPTETEVAVLKQGDGETVASGDLVTVQYRGVKWSDGTEFDSSWGRGAVPAQFPTTGVVTGFKMALEGQKVGSQVLVVMPPKDGYGEGEINDTDLVGESLVFVVDILGTTPIAQAAQ